MIQVTLYKVACITQDHTHVLHLNGISIALYLRLMKGKTFFTYKDVLMRVLLSVLAMAYLDFALWNK